MTYEWQLIDGGTAHCEAEGEENTLELAKAAADAAAGKYEALYGNEQMLHYRLDIYSDTEEWNRWRGNEWVKP